MKYDFRETSIFLGTNSPIMPEEISLGSLWWNISKNKIYFPWLFIQKLQT